MSTEKVWLLFLDKVYVRLSVFRVFVLNVSNAVENLVRLQTIYFKLILFNSKTLLNIPKNNYENIF